MKRNESIKNLTTSEISIYKYVLDNINDVLSMNIQELSKNVHASPSSIVRCMKKIGYDGFREFKYSVYNRNRLNVYDLKPDYIVTEERNFFNLDITKIYGQDIESARKILLATKEIIFFGIGTSGILAKYGARQFSNFGFNSKSIEDPFYPLSLKGVNNSSVGIIISESGETQETIVIAKKFKELGGKIMSITNTPFNSLTKISNINFHYDIKEEKLDSSLNITTQAPVVFLLELIIRKLASSQ
ncbi:MurR/RpiR family transcriptional regulator [Oenococcus oeni]